MAKVLRKKVKNYEEVSKAVKIEKNLGKGKKEVLKDEEYQSDQTNRNNPVNMLKSGQAIVGLTKGCKINMGNYQSAKIDVWISRVCKDEDKAIMDNLADISIMLDEQLEFEQSKLMED